MAKGEFVSDWTKELGFSKNPCHTEVPKRIQDFYVGYKEERKDLNLFILENHPFGTITGRDGYGKTSTLKWMMSQLKNRDIEVSYFNASDLRKERDLIEKLSLPLLNIYEKTIKKLHKKLSLEELGRFIYSKLKGGTHYLILVDDAERLPQKYASLFKYFFKNKLKVQVILAGQNVRSLRGIHEDDSLELKLDGLEEDEAIEMMKKRINNYGRSGMFPFQEGMLREIYRNSDGSPKKFLELAREKAVKLTLDKEYIQKEREKLGEKKTSFGFVSIQVEDKPEEDDFFDFDPPDEEEQKEILKQVEKKDYSEATDEIISEAIDDDSEPEPKKKKEDRSEAKKNEELLSELAKDFE